MPMKWLLIWLRRLAVVAALVAGAQWVLRRVMRSGDAGGAILPPIVGDTWAPVPTNPDRGD